MLDFVKYSKLYALLLAVVSFTNGILRLEGKGFGPVNYTADLFGNNVSGVITLIATVFIVLISIDKIKIKDYRYLGLSYLIISVLSSCIPVSTAAFVVWLAYFNSIS